MHYLQLWIIIKVQRKPLCFENDFMIIIESNCIVPYKECLWIKYLKTVRKSIKNITCFTQYVFLSVCFLFVRVRLPINAINIYPSTCIPMIPMINALFERRKKKFTEVQSIFTICWEFSSAKKSIVNTCCVIWDSFFPWATRNK